MLTGLIRSGYTSTSFMTGSANGLGRIIVPNPSPPPTSRPLPSTNSLTVADATHASSISLEPGLKAEKSVLIRTSMFVWRSVYKAAGNTSGRNTGMARLKKRVVYLFMDVPKFSPSFFIVFSRV